MLKQANFDSDRKVWTGQLCGELDAVQAPKLIEAVQQLLSKQKGGLELDCTQLDFVDSMGLGALVKLRKIVQEDGGAITMTHMKQRIYKLFVITNLENSFGIEVES
ncbi:STAS domain-containing protein [Eubacteriales bacterium OttesenSCG-928-K08]|nr:STAS domain-containing protein [Eubacteriales bacterium OttesenSCG-928-K08]